VDGLRKYGFACRFPGSVVLFGRGSGGSIRISSQEAPDRRLPLTPVEGSEVRDYRLRAPIEYRDFQCDSDLLAGGTRRDHTIEHEKQSRFNVTLTFWPEVRPNMDGRTMLADRASM
jgi:hypothetical protein